MSPHEIATTLVRLEISFEHVTDRLDVVAAKLDQIASIIHQNDLRSQDVVSRIVALEIVQKESVDTARRVKFAAVTTVVVGALSFIGKLLIGGG